MDFLPKNNTLLTATLLDYRDFAGVFFAALVTIQTSKNLFTVVFRGFLLEECKVF